MCISVLGFNLSWPFCGLMLVIFVYFKLLKPKTVIISNFYFKRHLKYLNTYPLFLDIGFNDTVNLVNPRKSLHLQKLEVESFNSRSFQAKTLQIYHNQSKFINFLASLETEAKNWNSLTCHQIITYLNVLVLFLLYSW